MRFRIGRIEFDCAVEEVCSFIRLARRNKKLRLVAVGRRNVTVGSKEVERDEQATNDDAVCPDITHPRSLRIASSDSALRLLLVRLRIIVGRPWLDPDELAHFFTVEGFPRHERFGEQFELRLVVA